MKLVDMVGYMNEYYEPVLQMEKFSNWKAKVFRDCVVATWPQFVIGLKKKTAPFSQPIRWKAETNLGKVTRVFPRFTLISCVCFELLNYVS